MDAEVSPRTPIVPTVQKSERSCQTTAFEPAPAIEVRPEAPHTPISTLELPSIDPRDHLCLLVRHLARAFERDFLSLREDRDEDMLVADQCE